MTATAVVTEAGGVQVLEGEGFVACLLRPATAPPLRGAALEAGHLAEGS